MKPLLLLLATAALLLRLGTSAGANTPPHYRLTVLPLTFQTFDELNWGLVAGGCINNVGQISGEISVRSGAFSDDRASIWQKGHFLNILDKTPVTKNKVQADGTHNDYTISTAINAYGKVVGGNYSTFSGAYSGWFSTAYLWASGQMKAITGFPADCNGIAFGVNDSGWIIGNYVYNQGMPTIDAAPPPAIEAGTHAFLYHRGRILPLWYGLAKGINNKGQIIGTEGPYREDRRDDKGILWRNGSAISLKMQPAAINDSGEIAGNIPVTDDTGKACLWRHGKLTRLSKQISHAYALNNRGQVVGQLGDDALPAPLQALLWQNGKTYNLNRCVSLPKGWVLERAIGINDNGWIIGEGSVYKTPKEKQTVKSFTFLLTPK